MRSLQPLRFLPSAGSAFRPWSPVRISIFFVNREVHLGLGHIEFLVSNHVPYLPNQEDHGFYPWVNWPSGSGCSPLVGVPWEPRALPAGLHRNHYGFFATTDICSLLSSAGRSSRYFKPKRKSNPIRAKIPRDIKHSAGTKGKEPAFPQTPSIFPG